MLLEEFVVSFSAIKEKKQRQITTNYFVTNFSKKEEKCLIFFQLFTLLNCVLLDSFFCKITVISFNFIDFRSKHRFL